MAMPALRRTVRDLLEFHMLTLAEQVTRAGYERLGAVESGKNFDFFAHVFPDGDWDKVQLVIAIDSNDVHAGTVDNKRAGGNDERRVLLRERKVHLGIHAGQQRSIAVIHL